MTKFILPFSLLLASILILVLGFFCKKYNIYTDSKTIEECNENHNIKLKNDGDTCGVWSIDSCWKGKYHLKDGTCVKPTNYVQLGLLSLSAGLFITFIVTLIIAMYKSN